MGGKAKEIAKIGVPLAVSAALPVAAPAVGAGAGAALGAATKGAALANTLGSINSAVGIGTGVLGTGMNIRNAMTKPGAQQTMAQGPVDTMSLKRTNPWGGGYGF